MHARKPWVWPTIEEFKGDVSTYVPQQAVAAYSETILGVVAAGMEPLPPVKLTWQPCVRAPQSAVRTTFASRYSQRPRRRRSRHGAHQPASRPPQRQVFRVRAAHRLPAGGTASATVPNECAP